MGLTVEVLRAAIVTLLVLLALLGRSLVITEGGSQDARPVFYQESNLQRNTKHISEYSYRAK